MTTALYPGSFDPIHLGHLGIVEHVAGVFDDIIVAVLGNPQKQAGLLSFDERARLVIAATAHLTNVRCLVHDGLTSDLARAVGADVLVRSAHKDLPLERAMAATNEMLSGIRTMFVAPAAGTRAISSSVVRDLVRSGDIEGATRLVPPAVAHTLRCELQP